MKGKGTLTLSSWRKDRTYANSIMVKATLQDSTSMEYLTTIVYFQDDHEMELPYKYTI